MWSVGSILTGLLSFMVYGKAFGVSKRKNPWNPFRVQRTAKHFTLLSTDKKVSFHVVVANNLPVGRHHDNGEHKSVNCRQTNICSIFTRIQWKECYLSEAVTPSSWKVQVRRIGFFSFVLHTTVHCSIPTLIPSERNIPFRTRRVLILSMPPLVLSLFTSLPQRCRSMWLFLWLPSFALCAWMCQWMCVCVCVFVCRWVGARADQEDFIWVLKSKLNWKCFISYLCVALSPLTSSQDHRF